MKVFSVLDPKQQRSLLVLFVSGLIFWMSMASTLPTLPLYIQSVGGTQQQIGLIMGAFAIGLLASRRMLGTLADRRSRKLVLLVGTAVCTIAPLGYLSIDSIPILLVVRAFHGISVAAFTNAYSALVADISPAERRGEIIGYMSLVTPIGVATGPILGGFVQANYGYGSLFVMTSILGVLSWVGATQVWEPDRARDAQATAQATVPKAKTGFWNSRRAIESIAIGLTLGLCQLLLTDSSLWISLFAGLQAGIVYAFIRQIATSPRTIRIPSIVMLIGGTIFGSISTFMPLFVTATEVDLNPGLFYATAAMASFSIRLFTGRASDRIGRGLFISISLICYAISMVLLANANSPQTFLIAACVEGIAAGTLIPVMVALMSDRSDAEERGRIFSLAIGGFDLGIAIAGPILGTVSESLGYRTIFALSAVLACVALGIFMSSNNKDVPHSLRFALGRGRDLYALDR
ncbi:MAG: MFS transporter [Cyanobacteriota bacterium]|nr:MFS transporter [Cyanobacteriota bacterium]